VKNELTHLPTWGKKKALHVVVESPRGCGIKLKFEPALGLITYGKALPLGLSYPYDWGFVAGTRAEDGDPLDALVLTDVPTYPGVVIPCRVLGMLQLDEKSGGKRKRNDRLVAIPLNAERLAEIGHPSHLPAEQREELEQFFLSTTFHTHKEARVLGWKGARYAEKKIRKARV
jgi:inorganic pyrophosphatase